MSSGHCGAVEFVSRHGSMGPWSLLLTTMRNVPKQALGLVKGVAKGLFRGVTAPLTVYVVLLGNLYLFYAGRALALAA